MRAVDRRASSGMLFVLAMLLPGLVDLRNDLRLFELTDSLSPEARSGFPHAIFHVLTPVVGLTLAALLLAGAVALGPYRRRERWAWWALALSGIAIFATKLWGTFAIYAHGVFGGLTVELEIPFLLWLAAVALSWRDFRPLG